MRAGHFCNTIPWWKRNKSPCLFWPLSGKPNSWPWCGCLAGISPSNWFPNLCPRIWGRIQWNGRSELDRPSVCAFWIADGKHCPKRLDYWNKVQKDRLSSGNVLILIRKNIYAKCFHFYSEYSSPNLFNIAH